MVEVTFYPDLTAPPPLGPGRPVDPSAVHVAVLSEADKSDPLNQLLSIGFRIGNRVGGRAVVVREDHPKSLEATIAALIMVVAEHAVEIRDAIAMENT